MDDAEVNNFCSNCKHEVPAANFMMHHIHCQRKLALCQKCDEPIPHSEFTAHNADFHAVLACPDCGLQVEKRNLSDHKSSACSHRAICCNFCNIEIEAKELMDHENYCGSRTERCNDCGEFVMLKYQQLHQDTNHGFLKLEDEPGPSPSWSTPRPAPSVQNDLGRQRKVSNASQDSTRPTCATNRLSPSKRTNDMPQVNSAANADRPKAFYKNTLPQAGKLYEDEAALDIDRFLALRLEEQENASVVATPSAPPDPGDLGGELVALPCEFCEAMIPANQLVIHETGCRPDLTQYASPAPRSRGTTGPAEEGLPCEFCGGLFAPQHLLQHETMCEAMVTSHVNVLGIQQPAARKMVNLESSNSRILPQHHLSGEEGGSRHPYLSEVRAALKKSANLPSIGTHQSSTTTGYLPRSGAFSHVDLPSTYLNGYTRHTASTGAVPKQKAGKSISIREVSKEVSSSTASSVTSPTSYNHSSNSR